MSPVFFGGGHEKGLRPGTMNVPAIVGFAKAAALAQERTWDDAREMSRLRTMLEQSLSTNGMGYVLGSVKDRLPNTTNILFPGFKAETIMTRFPQLAVATGSACTSALPEPSHVLKAMGLNDDEAHSAIRFSLGRNTTENEINKTIEGVLQIIQKHPHLSGT